jgi:hypothetical protein
MRPSALCASAPSTLLERLPANQLWPLAPPLLADSNQGVRIRAAALLAAVPTESQPPADRERFARRPH